MGMACSDSVGGRKCGFLCSESALTAVAACSGKDKMLFSYDGREPPSAN